MPLDEVGQKPDRINLKKCAARIGAGGGDMYRQRDLANSGHRPNKVRTRGRWKNVPTDAANRAQTITTTTNMYRKHNHTSRPAMNDICVQNNENTDYQLLQIFDTNILQDKIEGRRAKILMCFNVHY